MRITQVYDSLSGVHPNGNPLPMFHSSAEEVLAVCVPRALAMLAHTCSPDEAAKLQRLLRLVLRSACERRADLLAQRYETMSQLAGRLSTDSCNGGFAGDT